MYRLITVALLSALLPGAGVLAAPPAAPPANPIDKLYAQVTPSLVAVQYTLDTELGRRDLCEGGVVVSSDGMVIAPLAMFAPVIPDVQMKDFKIIVPRHLAEPREVNAIFLGRDERTGLAVLKPQSSEGVKWVPVNFQEIPIQVGEPVISVGLLPKAAGYRSYVSRSRVAAEIHGAVPLMLVASGQLTVTGSVVLDAQGQAIGFVNATAGQQILLNDNQNRLAAIINPPTFFVPTSDFRLTLKDPPVAGHPMKLPWIGLPQVASLRKDVAQFFHLENQPAVEIGDVIPGSPGDLAGLKRGMKIVKLNGQPLQCGDDPNDVAQIFARKILRMKVGQKITLSVLTDSNQPLKQVTVTLGERPPGVSTAKRFYDDALGLAVRQIVFADTYVRKLPADQKGVIVALLKPQGPAQVAKLQDEDLILQMNGKPVTGVEEFKKDFQQLRRTQPQEPIVFVVLRQGQEQTVRIEAPQ